MMRMRSHGNHRHAGQSRIAFPKFITRCHFSCLSHYADSESSLDLQQESLLESQHHPEENDFCHMNGSSWGYHGNSLQHRLDTDAMTTSSEGSENEEQEAANVTSNSSNAFNLQNGLNIAMNGSPEQSNCSGAAMSDQLINGHHFQMPKFNKRMWQDGFGRFHRDTIPRRDNTSASPVSSHRDSCAGDTSTGASWFVNPLMRSLNAGSNHMTASLKSASSTSSSELTDDDDDDGDDDSEGNGDESGLSDDALQDEAEQQQDSRHGINSSSNHNCTFIQNNSSVSALYGVSDARSGIMRSQLLLPGHSSSLAEVLQSLPQQPQNTLYTTDNQNDDNNMEEGQSALTLGSNQGQGQFHDEVQHSSNSQDNGHPSLFEIIDQIQQHIQDNAPSAQPEDSAVCSNDNQADRPMQLSTSSRSSTWSNSALIQQLLQVLVNNSPDGSTSHRSVTSTQSSGSTVQHNWYFYDRRLVPNHCAARCGNSAVIPQPPSYEEAAQDVGSEMEANVYLLSQLAVLPNEPPPPYPERDISPPPSYDSQSYNSNDSASECQDADNSDNNAGERRCSENNCSNENISHDQSNEQHEGWSQDPQRLSSMGLCRRPPVRWNRGMRLERWASTHNWAAEPVL